MPRPGGAGGGIDGGGRMATTVRAAQATPPARRKRRAEKGAAVESHLEAVNAELGPATDIAAIKTDPPGEASAEDAPTAPDRVRGAHEAAMPRGTPSAGRVPTDILRSPRQARRRRT